MSNYENIRAKIILQNFSIPILQTGSDYFPDFLKVKFDEYIAFYRKELLANVDETIPFEGGLPNVIISKIENFSIGLLETINKYYEGNILEATSTFNRTMDEIFFHDINALNTLDINTSFYRARKNENSLKN